MRPAEFKSEISRSELISRWTRLCAIRLHEEFSSVRVQVGNATIRLKLTSDQARCDQARGRVQFCQSSSRKCHAPQTLAGFVAQSFYSRSGLGARVLFVNGTPLGEGVWGRWLGGLLPPHSIEVMRKSAYFSNTCANCAAESAVAAGWSRFSALARAL